MIHARQTGERVLRWLCDPADFPSLRDPFFCLRDCDSIVSECHFNARVVVIHVYVYEETSLSKDRDDRSQSRCRHPIKIAF